MELTEKRISELSDMLCWYISIGDTQKALRIAQYLRAATGFHMKRGFHAAPKEQWNKAPVQPLVTDWFYSNLDDGGGS